LSLRREFWRTITTPAIWPVRISDLVNGAGLPFDLGKQISAMHALMFGQSNFFAPRKPTGKCSQLMSARGKLRGTATCGRAARPILVRLQER
jgi:hypothetical protein